MEQKTYITGFNQGYLLAKHHLDLVRKLVLTLSPRGEYLSGFFSGKGEFERENSRTRLEQLQEIRKRNLDREKDMGREEV